MAGQSLNLDSSDLETAAAKARAQAARIRDCADRMRTASGTASASGGRIEVSVDGFGTPTELHVEPDLVAPPQDERAADSGRERRAARIGDLVVDAYAAAAADLARRHGDLLAQMLPGVAQDEVPAGEPRASGNNDGGFAHAGPDHRGGRTRWH